MPASLLIVGLGNPGSRYENTPHSVGFEVTDALAARWGAAPWQAWKGKAVIAAAASGGRDVLLAKPGTFMNLSGEAVAPLLAYHNLGPEALIVVCDDVALPLGRTRLRPEGTSGGHRGLQSIIDHLGTLAFARLRIGVAPEEGLPCASEKWVLSKWSPARRAHLDLVLPQAVECVERFVADGIDRASNDFNGLFTPAPEA